MKKKDILLFAVILLLAVGIILISGCIEETKEKKSIDESETENLEEPPTWSFKGALALINDSDTYKLDLKDKPFGCLLTVKSEMHNQEYINIILLDSNRTPIYQNEESWTSYIEAVVDGGETYYVVVKNRKNITYRGDPNYRDNEYINYTVNVRVFPHSTSNSSDSAVPIEIPGKFKTRLISRPIEGGSFKVKDINWFKIGTVNSDGLLIIDYYNPSHSFNNEFKIYLFDDKAEVIAEGRINNTLRYPVDNGNSYYINLMHSSERTYPYPYSYPVSIDIDLVPNSLNNNLDNAIPIHIPETIESKVVSIKDANWYKLDLRDYSEGDIIINISFPNEVLMLGRMKMELLGENKTEIIGYVYVHPSDRDNFRQSTFIKGMPKTVGYYPKKGIGGGRVYYIKVYMEDESGLYNPPEPYKLEIKGTTIVPLSVMGEEPNMYTLTDNTADTAVTVNLPALMEGRIISEDDAQWFKTDLSTYSNGGVLIVTLTMPTKTEPSCEFVCRQPVCFNVPPTPPDCYHYQFEVFESDQKKKVMAGSVAPKDKTTFREVLKGGDQYYFKISAPQKRYNKEESYTIDVRFYPDK